MLLVDTAQRMGVNYFYKWCPTNIPIEDQLLMTLMKLRGNYQMADIAHRFGVSKTTVSNCFLTFTYFIAQILYDRVVHRKTAAYCRSVCNNQRNLPTQMWDCSDAFIEAPRRDLAIAKSTYSAYRGGYTYKFLISISADGAIVFVSEFFGGNTSDREMVLNSGILATLREGDLVLADKGFLVFDLLPPGVRLNLPSFLDTSAKQFTTGQVEWSRNIARTRVHVERAIGRMKGYRILQKICHKHQPHASAFLKCIAVLVNLQNPIIKS